MSRKLFGVIFIVLGVVLIGYFLRIAEFHRRTDEMVSGKPLPGSSPLTVLLGGVSALVLGLMWLLM